MQANEVIKNLMAQKEIKSQSGVSQALNRDMKISMLIRFLKVMDCSLTVTDNSTGETFEISE